MSDTVQHHAVQAQDGRWWLWQGKPLGDGAIEWTTVGQVKVDAICGQRGSWPGPWCSRCNHRVTIGFSVPDDVWQAVVRDRYGVLCSTCFDEEAEAANVPYSFGELHPVTWSEWRKENVDA